jgi:nitrite reductase (NADH) small subunit
MATTHVVGTLEDFPEGKHKVVRVRDIEIGIFNVAGTLHALPNLCFHQWGPLCKGQVTGTLSATAATNWKYEWVREGQIVVCPWHSLEFDVTTGQCLAYPRVKLRRYPIEVDGDVVRVVL